MPLVSSCSAAISAACHRPDEDFDSHLLPVRRGLVGRKHWCFTTSIELSYPKLGPGFEPKMLTKTSDSKQLQHELQIDVGPAFELPIQSQEPSFHDCAGMREQREEIDDTSALLPNSQDGI